ncbi:MAG: EAL domain-containing protein [Alphaproteobacteria bacterium]|nr:EAL domain-containing protein [Alphaproteobacteria bacterium]
MMGFFNKLSPESEFRIRIAYLTALFAMLILLGASYFLMNVSVDRSQEDSEILQKISQQRMLSQRIVLLSERALHEVGEQRLREGLQMLDDSIASMEGMHTVFARQVNSENRSDPAAQRLHDIYFSSQGQLDFQIRSLITNAKQLSRLASESPDIAEIYLGPMEEIAATQVLPAMDQVIDIYRQQAKSSIAAINNMHVLIIMLSLALLAVIWLFLFRPLANQVGNRTRELIAARDEMQYAAHHDGLTGLANREFAINLLGKATEAVAAGDTADIAIFQLDLDNFKKINDGYGHLYGDKLLETVGMRLQQFCHDDQVVCRMGGDEFIIVKTSKSEQRELEAIAAEVLAALDEPVDIFGVTLQIKTSIGIARCPRDAETAEDLLIASDLALYDAKNQGKGTYSSFTRRLGLHHEDTRSLEADIDRALDAGEFRPVFQPQVCLEKRQAVGMEVLIRWYHKDRGVLLPELFLSLATNSGRMPKLHHVIFDQALSAAAAWSREGLDFGRLSLNVSSYELQRHGFVDLLTGLAKSHGIPTSFLAAEINENVAIDDQDEATLMVIEALHNQGIQVEIDDMGTGFASLVHSNRNIFDRVKIDRQFIQDIDKNERGRVVVKSMINLAKRFDLRVVAKGMERQAEIDTLFQLGCNEFQGNAIATAMPADVARQWLAANQRTLSTNDHLSRAASQAG